MRKRGTLLVATMLVLAPLVGCTHAKDPHDVDMCSLLTKKEVAGYLGKAPKPTKKKDHAGGTICKWLGDPPGGIDVSFSDHSTLKTLPMQKKIKVNGITAWIWIELPDPDAECIIVVDTKPRLVELGVETDGDDPGPKKATCANVAKTLGKVVDRLGWKG